MDANVMLLPHDPEELWRGEEKHQGEDPEGSPVPSGGAQKNSEFHQSSHWGQRSFLHTWPPVKAPPLEVTLWSTICSVNQGFG